MTGEYVVLSGAKALSLPSQFGQSLSVDTSLNGVNLWNSYDVQHHKWFSVKFDDQMEVLSTSNLSTSQRLMELFLHVHKETGILKEHFQFKTELDFARNLGLGTSSTLISLLAQWSGVDPFDLAASSFGGSGYDIACATAEGPLLYRLESNSRMVEEIHFLPEFRDQLFFIALGQKQNTRAGIARYQDQIQDQTIAKICNEISEISHQMIAATTLLQMETLIATHEDIISKNFKPFGNEQTTKKRYFPDYWGAVKSLGAWGGDMVLVTSSRSEKDTLEYFRGRGYNTILNYNDIIYQHSKTE